MQEAIQGFGHPETFTSSHQHDNCRFNSERIPHVVNRAGRLQSVFVWIRAEARGRLFNSADSDLFRRGKKKKKLGVVNMSVGIAPVLTCPTNADMKKQQISI